MRSFLRVVVVYFVCDWHLVQEKLEQMFDTLDTDKSGWIEFGEFCEVLLCCLVTERIELLSAVDDLRAV